MANSNTSSTIKIFVIRTTLLFPFSHSSDANHFSSLMAVNIFLKIFIICVLVLCPLLYWGSYPRNWALLFLGDPVFSIVPNVYELLTEYMEDSLNKSLSVMWIVVCDPSPWTFCYQSMMREVHKLRISDRTCCNSLTLLHHQNMWSIHLFHWNRAHNIFCILSFYPTNLLKSLIFSSFFLVDSLVFNEVTSLAKKVLFLPFQSVCLLFVFLSLFIKTSRIMLNRADKMGYSCLILHLERKHSTFHQ